MTLLGIIIVGLVSGFGLLSATSQILDIVESRKAFASQRQYIEALAAMAIFVLVIIAFTFIMVMGIVRYTGNQNW